MEGKTINAVLATIALATLLLASWFYFRAVCEYRATYRTNAFLDAGDRARFRMLLHKHGLMHDVSIVYDWDKGKPYFYRNGRRCSFM
jgi:hypothetical protein